MTTKYFKISDMHCSSCVMKIESVEDKLPGIKQLDVNFKQLRMVAEYDEARVSADQIVAAVKQEGYEAIETTEAPKKGFKLWKR